VIKKVFYDNETARTIIKGAATIESASLGFLSVIAQNTNPKVLLGTLLGGINPSVGAAYTASRLITQQQNTKPVQQDFTDRQKMINDVRSNVVSTYKPMSETNTLNHTFDEMVITVEGDKDNKKHINIDANNVKDFLLGKMSGKYNLNNNGRSHPTEPYFK
jgi:hypothetical protein